MWVNYYSAREKGFGQSPGICKIEYVGVNMVDPFNRIRLPPYFLLKGLQ